MHLRVTSGPPVQPKAAGSPVEKVPEGADNRPQEDEESVVLELSDEAQKLLKPEKEAEEASAQARKPAEEEAALSHGKGKIKQSSNLQDESGALTRRLVAAKTTMEVSSISSAAHKNLLSLRIAASTGDQSQAKTARSMIRRLEKLIQRCNRKSRDLTREARLQQSQHRLERQKKLEKAREIEKQLREHIRKRKGRERKYLNDADAKQASAPRGSKLSSAEEARIQLQAQLQAQKAPASDGAAPGMPEASGPGPEAGRTESASVSGEAVPVESGSQD